MAFKGLSVRIIILLIVSDLIVALLMFSFKMVSMILQPGIPLGTLIQALVQSPFLWLAVLSMFSSFIVWMTILSNLDLSVAFPLGSLSFVLVPVFSILFLNEHISLLRWMGIGCIAVGIVLLSLTGNSDRRPV